MVVFGLLFSSPLLNFNAIPLQLLNPIETLLWKVSTELVHVCVRACSVHMYGQDVFWRYHSLSLIQLESE